MTLASGRGYRPTPWSSSLHAEVGDQRPRTLPGPPAEPPDPDPAIAVLLFAGRVAEAAGFHDLGDTWELRQGTWIERSTGGRGPIR